VRAPSQTASRWGEVFGRSHTHSAGPDDYNFSYKQVRLATPKAPRPGVAGQREGDVERASGVEADRLCIAQRSDTARRDAIAAPGYYEHKLQIEASEVPEGAEASSADVRDGDYRALSAA
jgi:hypothetical protein